MAIYPTPHIKATPADFGKTVLMPGDPLRSQFIAQNFLEDPKLVNNVRGVQGYTGTYHGVRVSVMASGMGMPSIGIYSHELYEAFGVKNIIRVGTAGAIRRDVKVRELVLGMGACTNSNFAAQFGLPATFSPIADFKLLSTAARIAGEKQYAYHVGNLFSTDNFYTDREGGDLILGERMGVLAVEMEAAALYMNAARLGGRALTVCSISDHLITGENLSAEERQTSFTDMMILALETAVAAEAFDS